MPTAFLIGNDHTIAGVTVADPPPSRYRMPKPRAWRQVTGTLEEALKAARGDDEQEMRTFYRVMGIDSLVYLENAQMSVAYLTKEQELGG